jgi:hypothetical protein
MHRNEQPNDRRGVFDQQSTRFPLAKANSSNRDKAREESMRTLCSPARILTFCCSHRPTDPYRVVYEYRPAAFIKSYLISRAILHWNRRTWRIVSAANL